MEQLQTTNHQAGNKTTRILVTDVVVVDARMKVLVAYMTAVGGNKRP